MKKTDFIGFQIIYFFSMSKEEQNMLIGETSEQWFIEEGSNNVGANYLMGICYSSLDYINGDPFDIDEVDEFRKVMLSILDNFDPMYWNFENLSDTEEWKLLRSLAKKSIDEIQPILHQIKKPFVIENLIHVDHYGHASKIRELLRKKGKKKIK